MASSMARFLRRERPLVGEVGHPKRAQRRGIRRGELSLRSSRVGKWGYREAWPWDSVPPRPGRSLDLRLSVFPHDTGPPVVSRPASISAMRPGYASFL